MPSSVSAPKTTNGMRISSNALWSTMPMPRSSAVTTEQIVRMMKRGENGSISVSMGPSDVFVGLLLSQTTKHSIGGDGHGYDKSRLYEIPESYRITCDRINPSSYRD